MKTFLATLTAIALFTTVAHAGDNQSYATINLGSTVLTDSGNSNDSVYNLNYGQYLAEDVRSEIGLDRTNVDNGDMTTVLGGVYKDFNNDTDFTPFVGLNVGYGLSDGTAFGNNNDDGLVYGVSGGSSYAVNETVDLVGQARYLRSDFITQGTNDYDSYALTMGARIKF